MKKKPLIVIAAGGTGGHMFPADALAAELKKHAAIFLVTDERGIQNYKGALVAFPHKVLSVSSPAFKSLPGKIKAVFQLCLSFFNVFLFLLFHRPKGVVGFGGYAAAPTVAAAICLRIPVIVHEQNAVVGKGNTLFLKFVRKLAISFPKTRLAPDRKSVFVGMPIRADIAKLSRKKKVFFAGKKINLLVIGGSQGAKVLSEVVPKALSLLPPFLRHKLSVVQQVKADDLAHVAAFYKQTGIKAELAAFFSDMPGRLSKADFFIGRSGASTLYENYAAGLPALYIPHDSLNGHQAENARNAAEAGAAKFILPSKLSPELLSRELTKPLSLGTILKEMSTCALDCAKPSAASLLCQLVCKEFRL